MIRVYSVKPHHGGFGMFDRSADCAEFPDLDGVEDYRSLAIGSNDTVEPLAEDDPIVLDAHGRIYNQDGGTVIGWRSRFDGEVTLELVVAD